MVFDECGEEPWRGHCGVVEGMREADGTFGVTVPYISTPGLPIVECRAAVGFSVGLQGREPCIDVVHAVFSETHVASSTFHDLVVQFEFLK